MRIDIPAAVYGKNLESPGKVPRQFHWMKRHPGFPDAAFSLADRWCQRFQWQGIDEDRHVPVVLWMPLYDAPGGALMLRFTDVGLDDRGRRGTLLLEAAWASRDVLRQSANLREHFLVQAVRTDSLITVTDCPTLCIQSESDIMELGRMLANKLSNTAILASAVTHGFSLQGVETLLFLDANTWRERTAPVSAHDASVSPPSHKSVGWKSLSQSFISALKIQRKSPWLWLIIVALLLMLLTLAGYAANLCAV